MVIIKGPFEMMCRFLQRSSGSSEDPLMIHARIFDSYEDPPILRGFSNHCEHPHFIPQDFALENRSFLVHLFRFKLCPTNLFLTNFCFMRSSE
jgi:hypothetical protein